MADLAEWTICQNCLGTGAKSLSIGPDQGSQRDPWRHNVILCDVCVRFLITSDFPALAKRHEAKAIINRD